MTTDDKIQSLIAQTLADPDVPAPVRAALERGLSLEHIRLDARGRWWHLGEPFLNERLAQLFSRSVHQTPQGTWLVTIGAYSYPVEVEDVGVHIHHIQRTDDGWLARCNDGGEITLPTDALRTDGDSWLGAALPDGRLARLIGSAHHHVGEGLDVAADADDAASQWIFRDGAIDIPIAPRPVRKGTKY